jgi:hypothetical protein
MNTRLQSLPHRRPVPQAIIDTFPTQLYAVPKLPTTSTRASAATHRSADTATAPGRRIASSVGDPTVVLIISAGKPAEVPGALPLAPLLAAQGSICSVGEDPAGGGQADADSASGGAGRLRRVRSSGSSEGVRARDRH